MPMITLPIELPIEQITEFCQRNPIQKLSLFGSILREDFHSESDIDMLVEFIPNSKIGYFELIGMEMELTEMLKRKVDLRTPAELSRYFRQKVLDSAQVIYVH
ncbi:MAG: nucleotidyltransferase family protein [Myxacorys chilensis ATA2-1-KO14]|nr:nucleotidyltransferase family protein [Myxacorys chilensis ATA2-1-KO14]